MIEQVIKCERYKQCKSKVPYVSDRMVNLLQQFPSTWLILFHGQQQEEGKHFCSELCLSLWLQEEQCKEQ